MCKIDSDQRVIDSYKNATELCGNFGKLDGSNGSCHYCLEGNTIMWSACWKHTVLLNALHRMAYSNIPVDRIKCLLINFLEGDKK